MLRPAAARWPPKRSRCAAAGREAGVQVVGGDRAAAALAALAVERDQDDGPRVALDEARGDDADHALVPALAGGHEHAVAALERAAALDLGGGGAQDRVLDALALAVALLELLGQRLRPRARRREQQVERQRRIAEPAGGVDARGEAEAEVGRAHARRVDAGARISARRPGRSPRASRRSPRAHERAVLVGAAARRRRPSRARRGRRAGRAPAAAPPGRRRDGATRAPARA